MLALTRIPGAAFAVLPGVGHVPMIDDPECVLAAILQTAARAEAPSRTK